jgi:hypothetical protein
MPYGLACLIGIGICVCLLQLKPFKLAKQVGTYGLLTFTAIGLFFHIGLHQRGQSVPFDSDTYYLGAKYYKELGYKYLYPAYSQALKEQTGQGLPFIRDISDRGHYFPTNEYPALELQAQHQFSPARWSQFTNDIVLDFTMNKDPTHVWFGVDHGFTASPWLTLELQPFTLIPINHRASLLSVDFILFALLFGLLGKYFGWRNALVGLSIYLFFPPAYYSFTIPGTSLLRFLWLVWLSAGLAAFFKRRWLLAGILLGLASLDRIFPIFFVIAAIWVLAVQAPQQEGTWRKRLAPWARLTSGVVLSLILGIGTTELIWPGHWLLQIAFLKDFASFPFANAYGWLKVVHFYPVGHFAVQAHDVYLFYDRPPTELIHQRYYQPFFLLWSAFTTVTICALAPLRLNRTAAVTLIGFFLIFQFTTLTYYYLAILIPITCIFMQQGWPGLRYLIGCALIPGAIFLCYSMTYFSFCFFSLLMALFFTSVGAWFLFPIHTRVIVPFILVVVCICLLHITRNDFKLAAQIEKAEASKTYP